MILVNAAAPVMHDHDIFGNDNLAGEELSYFESEPVLKAIPPLENTDIIYVQKFCLICRFLAQYNYQFETYHQNINSENIVLIPWIQIGTLLHDITTSFNIIPRAPPV